MPNALSLPAAPGLSAAQAGDIARRGRKLLRRGLLTHRQAVLLDCLLWSCRRPGQGVLAVSYSRLCGLCHMARETIAAGLRRLSELHLLTVVKRRVRISWIGSGHASRQAVNAYILHASNTEFSAATVKTELVFSISPGPDTLAAQTALAAVRERRLRAIFGLDRSSGAALA